MFKKRVVRIALVAVVALGAVVLTLTTLTGTSEAQGPGGGGRGAGAGTSQVGGGTGWNGRGGAMTRGGAQDQMGSGILLPPPTDAALTETAIAALQAGIQDEYHAYAVYQAVIDQFGAVAPFSRVQSAEAQHIATLEAMFERYGIAVPAAQPLETVPQFTTLAEACAAGAQAEIANLHLYDQWISQVSDYPDLVSVFTALRNASEFNHLPAFERCAG